LLFVSTAYAQDGDENVTDDDVNRVARELYCPICENTPLDVCETQACEDWRTLIREKLEAGQSDQQIIQYFADIYGERARATPTTSGLSMLVWIAPIVGAILGTFYFVRLLSRWLDRGSTVPETSSPKPTLPLAHQDGVEPDTKEYVNRVEKEIYES
jgi:cytochrome c-type biogenesis protein CcmH